MGHYFGICYQEWRAEGGTRARNEDERLGWYGSEGERDNGGWYVSGEGQVACAQRRRAARRGRQNFPGFPAVADSGQKE
jgi:hypothetical protein